MIPCDLPMCTDLSRLIKECLKKIEIISKCNYERICDTWFSSLHKLT